MPEEHSKMLSIDESVDVNCCIVRCRQCHLWYLLSLCSARQGNEQPEEVPYIDAQENEQPEEVPYIDAQENEQPEEVPCVSRGR
jgi:hypothetical protein